MLALLFYLLMAFSNRLATVDTALADGSRIAPPLVSSHFFAYPQVDPAAAKCCDPDVFGTQLEGSLLLPHICGHNLWCADVMPLPVQGITQYCL